jgi:hypothetical protein
MPGFKSGQVRFVLALYVLELLQQGNGRVSRGTKLLKLDDDFILPRHMSLALPDVAANHL